MAHQSNKVTASVTSLSPESKVDEKEKEQEKEEVDYNSLEEALTS
jgi:hypothetical protein|tara:strand:- start:147 stop:281 length:135 start_codon:yes stop_codon:yes gene_type:complete